MKIFIKRKRPTKNKNGIYLQVDSDGVIGFQNLT